LSVSLFPLVLFEKLIPPASEYSKIQDHVELQKEECFDVYQCHIRGGEW
jgi:hypothetical protein